VGREREQRPRWKTTRLGRLATQHDDSALPVDLPLPQSVKPDGETEDEEREEEDFEAYYPEGRPGAKISSEAKFC
jgi:hypothetical protein